MRPIIRDGIVIFDSKLGIWPFVTVDEAKRSSVNCPAGTLVVHKVNVDRAEYRNMLIDNLIPAIKRKVSQWMRRRELVIQQDGAEAHVAVNDPAIVEACRAGRWNIRLAKQPANSPDLNVHDMGFFCAIQALQHQEAQATRTELIQPTLTAFYNLSAMTLDNTFLSLLPVMECIIACCGSNTYKRPHGQVDTTTPRTSSAQPQMC